MKKEEINQLVEKSGDKIKINTHKRKALINNNHHYIQSKNSTSPDSNKLSPNDQIIRININNINKSVTDKPLSIEKANENYRIGDVSSVKEEVRLRQTKVKKRMVKMNRKVSKTTEKKVKG